MGATWSVAESCPHTYIDYFCCYCGGSKIFLIFKVRGLDIGVNYRWLRLYPIDAVNRVKTPIIAIQPPKYNQASFAG